MWLYRLGIHAYQCALRLASLRNRKARAMLQGRRRTLDILQQSLPTGARPVWVHAASLGEFEQGRPLMERLRREHPEVPIVLSFYSPSGYQVRRDWPGADAVVYLPADTPRAMRRFLDALQPRVAIIVKYEFWAEMLRELRRRQVPTYLISAVFRPGQAFFRRTGGMFRRMLGDFTRIYVQDQQSQRLLDGIGVKNVVVAGDTRFDRVKAIRDQAREIPELDSFTRGGTRLTFMAGSSWPADEDVYFPWLKRHSADVLSVIAPHEFDAARLAEMQARLAPEVNAVLLSEVRKDPALLRNATALIIDCFGLLSSAYRYAHIAYVGGGFGAGIHNINEAAVYDIPVLFGPNYGKFLEAEGLIQAGCAFPLRSCADLLRIMEEDPALLQPDPRAKAGAAAHRYICAHTGATDKIYADIFSSLSTNDADII